MAVCRARALVIVLFPDCREQFRRILFESLLSTSACHGSGSKPSLFAAQVAGSSAAFRSWQSMNEGLPGFREGVQGSYDRCPQGDPFRVSDQDVYLRLIIDDASHFGVKLNTL